MSSNLPPGVSPMDPHITGVWLGDPHAPYEVFDEPEREITGEDVEGWGVWKGEDERIGVHPTQAEARAVADALNSAIPNCNDSRDERGNCTICGEPDWDALLPEEDPHG